MTEQSNSLSAEEQRVREHALCQASAILRIDDIPVDPAVAAVLKMHAHGEITDQQLENQMRILTGQGPTP